MDLKDLNPIHDMDDHGQDIPLSSVRSAFTKWELENMSKNLQKAISKSEHNHLIKHQLKRLQSHGNTQALFGRQRYSKVLGVLGYEQLQLKPLAHVENTRDKKLQLGTEVGNLIFLIICDGIEKKIIHEQASIKEYMKDIISEMNDIDWLSEDEKQELINSFITDLASRYNDIHQLMDPHLSPNDNKRLVLSMLRQIKNFRDVALEKCKRKRQKMDQAGIFKEKMNSGRMISCFRVDLNQKINMDKISKIALAEVEGNNDLHFYEKIAKTEIIQSDVQDLQSKLNSMTHPTPKLAQIPIKIQNEYDHRHKAKIIHSDETSKSGYKFVRRVSLTKQMRSNSKQKVTLDKRKDRYGIIFDDLNNLMKRYDDSKKSYEGEDEGEEDENTQDNEIEEEANDILGQVFWLEQNIDPTKTLDWLTNDSTTISELNDTNLNLENPLLKSHAELNKNFKRTQFTQNFKPIGRYLESSKFFSNDSLAAQAQIEDKEVNTDVSEKNYTEIVLNDKTIVRSINTTISERHPFSLISLDADLTVDESQEDSDSFGNVDSLDEKLKRFKEVEELYDEIMKTIVGDHLQTSEADENTLFGCPVAPNDPHLQISNVFRGFKNNIQLLEMIQSNSSKPTTAPGKEVKVPPTIKLFPRDPEADPMNADIFRKNRKRAMLLVPSSKHKLSRYNFGGYVPSYIEKKTVKAVGSFGLDDYKDHLRIRKCDFVADIIVPDHVNKEIDELNEAELKLKMEQERLLREEEEAKDRKKQEILKFRKGIWNVEILDYLSDIRGKKGTTVSASEAMELNTSLIEKVIQEEEEEGTEKKIQDVTDDKEQQESPIYEEKRNLDVIIESNSSISERSIMTSHSKKLSTPTAESLGNTDNLLNSNAKDDELETPQRKLEKIWLKLKMPLDQKLDMAIKYGNHRFKQMDDCVALWEKASDLILEREVILHEIEAFEGEHLDPERFFKNPKSRAIQSQAQENQEREDLLKRLHSSEGRISEVVSMIKHVIKETVTFEGVPIIEKMKFDHSDLIKRVEGKRDK